MSKPGNQASTVIHEGRTEIRTDSKDCTAEFPIAKELFDHHISYICSR